MYKTERVDYANGFYVPGTEVTLYEGDSLLDAQAAFDHFEETDTQTAIISAYHPDENHWELIKEK